MPDEDWRVASTAGTWADTVTLTPTLTLTLTLTPTLTLTLTPNPDQARRATRSHPAERGAHGRRRVRPQPGEGLADVERPLRADRVHVAPQRVLVLEVRQRLSARAHLGQQRGAWLGLGLGAEA